MSTTFRTAVVRTPGGPDAIEIIDVPVVEPGPRRGPDSGRRRSRSIPSTSESRLAASTPWG